MKATVAATRHAYRCNGQVAVTNEAGMSTGYRLEDGRLCRTHFIGFCRVDDANRYLHYLDQRNIKPNHVWKHANGQNVVVDLDVALTGD